MNLYMCKNIRKSATCLILRFLIAGIMASPAYAGAHVGKDNNKKKKIVVVAISTDEVAKTNKKKKHKKIHRDVASTESVLTPKPPVEVAFGGTEDESNLEPLNRKQCSKIERAEKKEIAKQKAKLQQDKQSTKRADVSEDADSSRNLASVKVPPQRPSLKKLLKKYKKHFAEEVIEE